MKMCWDATKKPNAENILRLKDKPVRKHNKVDGEDLAASAYRSIKKEELALFTLYPIGTTIEVLGRTLKIVGHQGYIPYISSGHHRVPSFPGVDSHITCMYSCNEGKIHKQRFSIEEVKTLFTPEAIVPC